jgi:phosphoglycerol transferase MdoB-like AlkP superfamily enzyme
MKIKAIIFFIVLFSFLLFGYFFYDWFSKIVPLEAIIKLLVLFAGLLSIFFPKIIEMFQDGKDNESIKEFIIKKYQKK